VSKTSAVRAPIAFHVRGGRLLDPKQGVFDEFDVIVLDGRIARIGKSLATPTNAAVIDARGKIIAPGFVDLHAHLREPGDEGKETIETGSNAAAVGGFTALCAMPNTQPPHARARSAACTCSRSGRSAEGSRARR